MKNFFAHVRGRRVLFRFTHGLLPARTFECDHTVLSQWHFDALLRPLCPYQVDVHRLCDDEMWALTFFLERRPYVLSVLARPEFVESLRECEGVDWLREGLGTVEMKSEGTCGFLRRNEDSNTI